MATVIVQKWDGLTPEQYDRLRAHVKWDSDIPAGMTYHVASYDHDTLHMTDVWDSEEQFVNFVQTRILPGLQELGIEGMPESLFMPTHEVFDLALVAAQA
jgi:hypothetical protein